MDGAQFDTLIKRLATTRLTRLAALRGLAAGAVASLTGVDFSADEAEAARSGRCRRKPGECETCKKGKCERKNGEKTCKRGKIKPKAAGTPCSLGTCQSGACVAAGTTPTTPTPTTPGPNRICTPNTQTGCTGGRVCNAAGTACIDCSSDDQCGTEFDCEAGRCVPETPPD